ncbi:hypothetical protein [Virgibacillus oceani]|uniref:Uncharacterized protein n=1 Tax=Virgibacillus oceani TaxID=1479511 RepID=A0A917M9T0_9BACI|nr:hypothetical protein [Virgibacillus oceani]GGG86886.1 hypothetical protein GCM10011398_35880 [Virgibacillus oceani]
MKDMPKKKFPIPTKANTDGEIGIHNGLNANHPFQSEDNFAGDSVDEHKKLESANEELAEKEIAQAFNNS